MVKETAQQYFYIVPYLPFVTYYKMRDFSQVSHDNGFSPLLSPFTIVVTPPPIVLCQEAELVVVVKAPLGIYCSNSSQLYPLPPLPPWPASGSTATVLLLLRLGWPLANPPEVFLRESAAGPVIVTVSGCSQLGPAQLQLQANANSMGKLLVSVSDFLVCFSFCS